MPRRYSVVGLGKLGASIAAAIASRGFPVIGVDVERRAVELLNSGRAPAQEPGLHELVARNAERLFATTDYAEAVHGSDLTFVVVPTPSDPRGAFSLEYAACAFREIGRALATKNAYHMVVLTSTVLPGSTRFGLLPILESRSGKRPGPDFGLCYGPVFIALGSVVHDFLNPDFTLVGELDERSGDAVESFYAEVLERPAPCKRMSIENAELTKIAVNSYVTMKMTFANVLGELCDRIPGGNVDVVTDALGTDRRIGRAYLTAAGAYGGPCFPRDNRGFAFLAEALDADAALAVATDEVNRRMTERVLALARPYLRDGCTVGVLGLAYKPGSNVVEESQGILLARALAEEGVRVIGYDPLGAEAARTELGDGVMVTDRLEECLRADVLVVTTPDPAFGAIGPGHLGARESMVTVVDLWRALDGRFEDSPNVRYIGAGRGEQNEASAGPLASLWEATRG